MKKLMKKLVALVAMAMVVVTMLPTPAVADDTITVHTQVPADWTPYLWAWTTADGSEPVNYFSEGWPGKAFETQTDGWYTLEIGATVNNIIVSNSGSPQTADIAIEAGKDVWVTVAADATYELSYEAPAGGTTDAPADDKQEPATEDKKDDAADKKDDAATDKKDDTKTETKADNNMGLYIGIAAAVVVVIIIVVVLLKKKK